MLDESHEKVTGKGKQVNMSTKMFIVEKLCDRSQCQRNIILLICPFLTKCVPFHKNSS